MVVLRKNIPLLTLEAAILEDMKAHSSGSDTHGVLLLPATEATVIKSDEYHIAMTYRTDELTPLFMEFFPKTVLSRFAHLFKQQRVPYILFLYDDAFRSEHLSQLQFGHTTRALIEEIAGVCA